MRYTKKKVLIASISSESKGKGRALTICLYDQNMTTGARLWVSLLEYQPASHTLDSLGPFKEKDQMIGNYCIVQNDAIVDPKLIANVPAIVGLVAAVLGGSSRHLA